MSLYWGIEIINSKNYYWKNYYCVLILVILFCGVSLDLSWLTVLELFTYSLWPLGCAYPCFPTKLLLLLAWRLFKPMRSHLSVLTIIVWAIGLVFRKPWLVPSPFRDFSAPLQHIEGSELNYTTDKIDLINTYRIILFSSGGIYIFSSNPWKFL